MLIRKNTKAFKTIQQLFTACQDRADRQKLIRLFITKAGDSIQDRISADAIEGGAALFYEMTYQTVLNNLRSSNHQLQVSDDVAGVYYFHSSSNKVWDETPFEFDEAIKKEFVSLPELPLVRRKEAAGKYTLPSPKTKGTAAPKEKGKIKAVKAVKDIAKAPEKPRFNLKHEINFTNLDKLVYRQANLSKGDLLQYYNDIAEYLLPYVKDRPLLTRFQTESPRAATELTLNVLFKEGVDDTPPWLKTVRAAKGGKDPLLLCNDREHLLFYVERGCVEFIPTAARIRDVDSPDYLVMTIESPDSDLTNAVSVIRTVKDILTGLQLPSFTKTDGGAGVHIYIALQAGSEFQTSCRVAEYICKLTRLKLPNIIALKGSEGSTYGKVALDYTLNNRGQGVIAPYSLVAGHTPIVATPVLWEEVEEGLRPENFNHVSIFKRLKATGDPFESMFKKRVNADDLLERLQVNYDFLF